MKTSPPPPVSMRAGDRVLVLDPNEFDFLITLANTATSVDGSEDCCAGEWAPPWASYPGAFPQRTLARKLDELR